MNHRDGILPSLRGNESEMRMKSWLVSLSTGLLALAVHAVCMAQAPAAVNETYGLPAQYAATAYGQAGRVAGKSFGLTIFVTDLTDDATVQTLEAALKDKVQDGLVSALGKIKDKGRVARTGSVGTGSGSSVSGPPRTAASRSCC